MGTNRDNHGLYLYYNLILYSHVNRFTIYDYTIHNAIGHNIPNTPWRRYDHTLYLDPYPYPTLRVKW